MGFIKDFKDFIAKGNVLELAVAVIIAGAFGAVIASLTRDIIMPPIGMILGGVDFSSLVYTLQEGVVDEATGEVVEEAVEIRYGVFALACLDFVIIALVIFILVRAYENSQKKPEVVEEDPGPTEIDLLKEIRDALVSERARPFAYPNKIYDS